MNNINELKRKLINAGYVAVNELIRIAESPIMNDHIIQKAEENELDDDPKSKKKKQSEKLDLTADKMKNAAGAKKLAIFDAFEILQKIQQEEVSLIELEKVQSGSTSTPMASPETRGMKPR